MLASNLPSRVQVLLTSSSSGTRPSTRLSRAGERKDAVSAVAQGNAGKRLGAARGDRTCLRREPVERRVVKDDRHVAGGALQIDFDGQALAHGGANRRGAVLDDALGGIVQAAMGDRPLQPIEFGHGEAQPRGL